jgi:dTDP-glucose pyrophosphorylase
MNVVLPIAGLGQRFIDSGYEKPKPLIDFNGQYLIEKALKSLNTDNCNLFFIVRQEHIDQFNIDIILKDKFGDNIHITSIDYTTEGAVCTCMLVAEYIDNNNELVIFTPDCYFEPQFDSNQIDKKYDAMVVVFNSDSPAHSYVTLDNNGYVTNAAEKEVISNYAVGGLYYYRKGSDFVKYTKQMIKDNNRTKNEFYICPVFNYLIKDGGKIGIDKNSKHLILGTPKDLEINIDE